MPIYKRCTYCGSRIQSGSVCPCVEERRRQSANEYDHFGRNDKAREFYQSKEWKRTRDEVLERDDYIDQYLLSTTGKIEPAAAVHHIVPLTEDWSKRCDPDNLISLSISTHSQIERLYKTEREQTMKALKEIAKGRGGQKSF